MTTSPTPRRRDSIEVNSAAVSAFIRSKAPSSVFALAVADAIDLAACLQGDVLDCTADLTSADTPARRRDLVRCSFAFFEGVAWALKSVCLATIGEVSVDFSTEEVVLLRDHMYKIKDSGAIDIGTAKPGLLGNLQFTARMIERVSGATGRATLDRPTENALRCAIQVRHRMTHPKNLFSLTLTDTEVADLHTAVTWFWEWAGGCLNFHRVPFMPHIEMLPGIQALKEHWRRNSSLPAL